MEEEILSLIKANDGRLTFKNIVSKININKTELQDILLKLKLDGQILQNGNRYQIFPKDLYVGRITISQNGRKYIFHDGEKITVSSDFFDEVILNDMVTFKINEFNEAVITSIVDRPLGKMTCEIKEIDGKKKIIPFHNNLTFKFDNSLLDTFMDGDIILVNIDQSDIDNILEAKFIKKIGRRDDPLMDDVAIALNFGFDNNYDDDYLRELDTYPVYVSDDDIKDSVDLRNQKCFTIDGANTKDMDDGVYAEMLDNNVIRIYVHIARVSHYIKPESKAFQRACEKTTSLYMNNSVFHMLHHIISNGICSLNPNVDRLAKTVVMDINPNGEIINYDIVDTVINSKKKMVYEDVDEILMNNKMVAGYEDFLKELYLIYDAAIRLEKRYVLENGKINFANTELSITYNDDGTIKSVANKENSVGRKIIENLMIAANETVANWFINMDMFTVFRVHEFPDLYKVNSVIEKLNKEGYHIKPIKNIEDSRALQEILQILSTYPEYPIISQLIVMTMQRAKYSTENLGHYALGLPAYLHFTSPIRRLADLLVHMMIDLIMKKTDKLTPEYLKELESYLKHLCDEASRMERQADMAEAIAERRQILKTLAKNKDSYYEATVIEIGNKIKIRLEGVETYFDSHTLNKIFGYDSKRKRYYDRETGGHLKIGSKLWVKITNVDAINDNFSVKVYGMVNDNCKKKVLKK